jgi:hypothetical protein
MPGKSDFFENAILNAVFRNGAFPTLGTSIYIASKNYLDTIGLK